MSGNSAFSLEEQTGWQAGLQNQLSAEFRRWWKTRTWWVQSLIWISVIDLILITVLSATQSSSEMAMPTSELIMLYGVFGGMFTAVGVVIVMQDVVVGEKVSGTAAWVLSKPISRPAFILAKLIANTASIAVTYILLPGIFAYLILNFGARAQLSPLNFLGGMAALLLFNLYFLALTLMLGAFFNHRGPVIGIPLAVILGQQFIMGMAIKISPVLVDYMPYNLVLPPQTSNALTVTGHIMLGTTPDSWMPVYSSLVAILLFVLIAIWRFRREEF